MTREWQPKVTAIKESQNLNALSMITLFGKLKEREHEINRFKLSQDENKLKERKLVAFKASSSKASSSSNGEDESGGESPNEEDMVLFVKRFNRYIKKHELRRSDKAPKRIKIKGENNKEENGPSCFGCCKVGHLKGECPELIKSKGRARSSDKSKGRTMKHHPQKATLKMMKLLNYASWGKERNQLRLVIENPNLILPMMSCKMFL
jgi:hypothetical protein